MNTDMVPTGSRDDIESGEFWNKEWANIAGALFFEWLNDLIDDEEYNLSSIFRLVPNFELCKEQHVSYTKFIDNFQNGFENELKEKVLIPVEGEKKNILSDTILDTTGFTSSEIITDEDFYKVTGYVISLPANELRGNADFEKVQKDTWSNSKSKNRYSKWRICYLFVTIQIFRNGFRKQSIIMLSYHF